MLWILLVLRHPLSLRVCMSRSIPLELTANSTDTAKLPIKSHHCSCMCRRLSFIYLWTSLASLFIRRISLQSLTTLSVHFRSSCLIRTRRMCNVVDSWEYLWPWHVWRRRNQILRFLWYKHMLISNLRCVLNAVLCFLGGRVISRRLSF